MLKNMLNNMLNNVLKKYRFYNFDFLLVAMVVGLTIFGTIAIGMTERSEEQIISPAIKKQIAGIVFCFCVMLIVSLIDYTFILNFYIVFYIANLVLLALIFTPLGKDVNGARRWIMLPVINRFQPSESAKIILILFFAQFIMKYKDKVKNMGFILVCLLLLGIPAILIKKQPDLSTCITIVIILGCMLFVAGIDWRLVAGVLVVGIIGVTLVIYAAGQGNSMFLAEYQQTRIMAWLHPEEYTSSAALQTTNSKMAIGSGQLTGKEQSEIVSILNSGFVSESETDFIFAVVGEEFGFIGGCGVIAFILLIAIRCFRISMIARDKAGELFATGVGAWVGFQGLLNIGVATGVLPNTGLPLPFVSSGLTSLLCLYVGVGIVLNIRLQSNKYI